MDDVAAEFSMKTGSGDLPDTDLKEAIVTLCIDNTEVATDHGKGL